MSKPSEQPYKALRDKLLSIVGDKRQSDVARELYVSQPEAHNYLSGKRRPEPWRLGLLAALYNESPEELAQLAGYDENPDALQKVLDSFHDRRSSLS
jgi:hypothetical protein